MRQLKGDTPLCNPLWQPWGLPRQEPALELLPYPEALTAEGERQIREKQGDEYTRGRNQLPLYSVWYLRNKRP